MFILVASEEQTNPGMEESALLEVALLDLEDAVDDLNRSRDICSN